MSKMDYLLDRLNKKSEEWGHLGIVVQERQGADYAYAFMDIAYDIVKEYEHQLKGKES